VISLNKQESRNKSNILLIIITLVVLDDVKPPFAVERNADVVVVAICGYHSRLFQNIVHPVHLVNQTAVYICMA